MSKTNIEKIETLQEKIQQLENEKKRLLNAQKEAERKARTKRLIERGAILESLVPGAAAFTNEQIKAFLEKTVGNDSARKILAGMAPQSGAVDASTPVAAAPKGGASATGKSASTEQGAG